MARRKGPPKERKPKLEPERLLLVEKALAEIMGQHHGHLGRAKIIAVNKAGKAGRSLCDGIVKLRVATPAERAIAKEDTGDIAYVVEVRTEPYEKLSAEGKKRRLDHALCHAGGRDEKERWFTVLHDVAEFRVVLDRHGPPDDNPAFVPMAKQMALFAKGGKS